MNEHCHFELWHDGIHLNISIQVIRIVTMTEKKNALFNMNENRQLERHGGMSNISFQIIKTPINE